MRDMSVVRYDARWPTAYEEESTHLLAVLGAVIVSIHHIGSTAVPDLAAKPVIDILMEVRDLQELDGHDEAMRSIGYVPRGEYGIPGRRYYPKGGDARTHHVHAFTVGDRHVAEHIAFRDYLRAHPHVAAEYADVKRKAAAAHGSDPEGYQAGKHEFVFNTLGEAVAWAKSGKA